MQYQSEALEALKSMTNLGKPFEKVIMDVLKLFMAMPKGTLVDGGARQTCLSAKGADAITLLMNYLHTLLPCLALMRSIV